MTALIRAKVRAAGTSSRLRRSALTSTMLLALFLAGAVPAAKAQQKSAAPAPAAQSAAVQSDLLLKAMREELDRSKSKLKMDDVPAPYYIEYRLSDVDEFSAEA